MLLLERRSSLGVEPVEIEKVVIHDFPTGKKIAVIKVVREATGLGLKESKDLVDAVEGGISVSVMPNDQIKTAVLVRELQVIGCDFHKE